jgi:DNA polymerase-3 subunit alpha
MRDIDMDFPHNKRNSVFEAIFEKWDNVVRISNHVTYGQKGAIRKALKELGVKGIVPKNECNINYFKDKDKKNELIKKINEIRGKFKNFMLHCGGIIFYTDINQVEKDIIKDRQISWNKVDVDMKGFFKIDILSNRGLSQLFDISSRPLLEYDFTDMKTIELLQSGNNLGLTFAESPAMRKILSIYKPKNVQDIALCLAAIRPGAEKNSEKNDEMYYNDNFNDINNTIIFDDDAIFYIMKLLKCDESKADNIRRLYSKGDKLGIQKFELELSASNPELDIDAISNKLINLKKYSFCKSHALSYAYLVWALAYQKAHHPRKFWRSTIKNCSSMYKKWVHVRQGLLSGLKILGDDTLPNIEHFYKYGYWIKEDFIDPDMYVKITDKKKSLCEFRGLIASYRFFKKYNKDTKKNDFVTFITIGYMNDLYIDIIVKKWIAIKNRNVCSGNGIFKSYNGHKSINVEKITFG